MTRGEAVRVLPATVSFGERAVPHLLDGLRSRKGFLRQGCALALGVLKSADGIEPLCDLLTGEPTDMWPEIARAIGELGPGTVMSLVSRLKDAPEEEVAEEERRERVALALAHVAARGGETSIEMISGGRDAMVAGVARRALELRASVLESDAEVHGASAPRDQTVNRAFSRRFFEAMAGNARASESEEMPLEDAEILEEEPEALAINDDDLMPG